MTARSATVFPAAVDAARTRTGRIGELDAVRGIAALVVVLHHCWQTLLPDQNTFPFVGAEPVTDTQWWAAWLNLTPLKLLVAGHPAVGVFFVLSGLVLTRQLQGARRSSYAQFVVRRVFRIWVPFALVIALAALLCSRLGGPLPQLPWINESWNQPVTWTLIAGHLLMLGTSAYVSLDNPMWSLVHEMRISLVFPVLARIARRHLARLVIGALAVFTVLSITHLTEPLIALCPGSLGRELLHSLIQTVRYGLFFVLGIVLALKSEQLGAWLRAQSPGRKVRLWMLAILLLAMPYLGGYVELAYALGAFLLLALCMHSQRARKVLAAPVLAWLGRVSYSLYLVHLLVLLSLVHALQGVLPVGTLLVLGVVASLVIADLTNRLLELPANHLGKRIAASLGRPLPAAVEASKGE